MSDLYEILGVPKTSDISDIKKAYYKLARENHPDKVADADKEKATQKIQKINEAYEILSDPEKKKIYDAHGLDALNGLNHSNGFSGFNFSGFNSSGFNSGFNNDMFSQMFGFNKNNQNNTKENKDRKNKETIFNVNITLKDVYSGISKKLKVTRKVIYKKTNVDIDITNNTKENNQVNVEEYKNSWEVCEKCKGSGIITELRQIGPGMISQSQKQCNECMGHGYKMKADYYIDDMSEIVKIDVPKGVINGTKFKFSDMGNCAPGFLPGDLIVQINSLELESGFIRKGSDLLYNKEIKLVDALCGFTFIIETLDNRKLKIECKDVIKPDDKKIIHGEGICKGICNEKTNEKESGDLIINFHIKFPKNVKDKEKIRKYL